MHVPEARFKALRARRKHVCLFVFVFTESLLIMKIDIDSSKLDWGGAYGT